MVRKLLKSTVAGKPSFLAVGLSCRRSRLRRCIGPPRRFVKTKSSGLHVTPKWELQSNFRLTFMGSAS